MPTSTPETVRLDKWLWAVRLFKTRALATAACQAGHVKIHGVSVKPARTVHLNDLIDIQLPESKRTVKVLAPLAQRVGARLVPQYLEDLTPAAEREVAREPRLEPLFHRPKGSGRPTKRERRLLEHLGFPADPE